MVGPAVRLNSQPASATTASAPPSHIIQLASSSASGQPLPESVQAALESSFGVSLGEVRVHTDARSSEVAAGMGARAFTYGTHIFLGPRERATDLQLIAHEVTHVVQQQGRPIVQMCCAGCCGTTSTGDSFEREASHAAAAVTSGVPFTVQGRTSGAQVQKEDGGQEDEGLLTRMLWALLEEISPEFAQMLREIMRQGVLEWLKGKISAAVESIFNTLAAPVRTVTGVVASLSLHFNNLLTWIRDAASRIARGDCGAITEAAEKIQQVFEGLAAPVIDRIKNLADRVKGFFSDLWGRFGAPAWEFLRNVGGQAWEKIQQFGRWIWEKTARVRSTLERAWRWIKNRLGIGEGEEGQNGLLQWVQRKASQAWDWLKERLEPIKRPLMVVGGILVMLSPAGPIIAIGAAVGGLMVGIRWIRQHMSRPGGVVEQRNAFERTIIPAIMGAVNGVTAGLQRAAAFVTDKLNGVMAGLGDAVGAVAGSIFRFAVGIIQWIADQFRGLVAWGNEKLMGLVDWVRGALESLRAFLQPILNVLGQIARVVGNIMQLPFLIAGRLWNMIPACIRDPFINFFIPLILSRIPLFQELVATPEAWAETRAGVMTIIRQVFRDHDLIGAMKSVFRLLLRALAVPVELAGRVLAKAATAWDAVLEHPIQFLKNILRAMGEGFRRFFGNILSHLLFGVSGWIFGELREIGVQPPSSWTDLRAVFGFVLSVLGISIEHIFQLLGRRLSPDRVQQLRRVYNVLTGAWEWVKVAINEGPAGIWRMLVERLRDLGTAVLRAAVDWIIDRIVTRVTARLLSMLDPTGIMAVVNALVSLYQAIQTVVRYARQILEIVNTVLDTVINIAGGVIGPAAEMMENAMRGAMPVIIAFLANQAGLSGLGARMREIIAGIRERVDNALLWLIDRAMQAINAILNLVRSAVGAVADWWRARKEFVADDGQNHSLFIQGSESNPVLMMASDVSESLEAKIEKRLRSLRRKSPRPARKISALESARTKKGQLDDFIRNSRATQPGRAGGPSTEMIRSQIQTRLEAIRVDLVAGEIIGRNDELPLSNVTYRMSGTKAGMVKGDPLTKHPGNTQGEPAETSSASPPGWAVASVENSQSYIFEEGGQAARTSANRLRLSRDWKRVHLISAAYHGPAQVWNLVPAKTNVNAAFLSTFETKAKNRLDDDKQLFLQVDVHYYGENTPIEITGGDEDEVLATARKSDYPESFTVLLKQKNEDDEGFTNVVSTGIPGTALPNSGSLQNLDITKQHIEARITNYINSTPVSQLKTWGEYVGGNINSRIRRKLGQEKMAEIRDFYQDKLEKKQRRGR